MPALDKPVALPKSTSGRRGKPIDEKFAKALHDALIKTPEVDGRPALHTNADRFDTKGKAAADGRRYAELIQKNLSDIQRASVRVFPDGNKFGWGLYLRTVSPESSE